MLLNKAFLTDTVSEKPQSTVWPFLCVCVCVIALELKVLDGITISVCVMVCGERGRQRKRALYMSNRSDVNNDSLVHL